MTKSTLIDILFCLLLLNLTVMVLRVLHGPADGPVRDAAIASIVLFGLGGAASLFCRREWREER